jgi:hypothetical protein
MTNEEIEIAKHEMTELSIKHFGSVQGVYSTAVRAINAFQKGLAINTELLRTLEDVCKSIECHEAERCDFVPEDEYDEMMFPKWQAALLAVKRARGEA